MASTSCLGFATCRTQTTPPLVQSYLTFEANSPKFQTISTILKLPICHFQFDLIFSMSSTEKSSQPILDLARDILLWRRKKMSVMVFFISTATWVLMEVYQFNFITIVCWVGMAVVTSLFIWGNMCRLLGKEPPSLSGLKITEQSTTEVTILFRESIEEAVRWMFRVGAESEWYVFAGVVTGLWILSIVGSCMDLLTLAYIGIMMSMTIPVIYIKYEDKIKSYGERVKVHWRKLVEIVDEKVFMNVKNKLFKQKEKENEKKGMEKEKKVE